MGRSRHLNVDCARSQEAYFARIREAAHAAVNGADAVGCPRDACPETLEASQQGDTLVLRCPSCGLIYRGSLYRLLEFYE